MKPPHLLCYCCHLFSFYEYIYFKSILLFYKVNNHLNLTTELPFLALDSVLYFCAYIWNHCAFAWRTYLNIYFSVGLLAVSSQIFYLLEHIFIFLSYLKDIFAKYVMQNWKLFSFCTLLSFYFLFCFCWQVN